MAGNKHLLFIATACLGGAAVGFAIRTKAKVPIVEVEGDTTMSDAPLGMLETAEKLADDHAYPETPLIVQLPTVETVDKSADVRRADISHLDVGHTSNGLQQISMVSTSPTHEAHWNTSFLDAFDGVACSEKQIHYVYSSKKDYLYHLENCGAGGEGAQFSSHEKYGQQVDEEEHMELRVKVGDSEFDLGQIEWDHPCRFRCIMTRSTQNCEEYLEQRQLPPGEVLTPGCEADKPGQRKATVCKEQAKITETPCKKPGQMLCCFFF